MQEKIWVVIQRNGSEIASVLAFDHETDAQNFAQEMDAAGRGSNDIYQTTVSRRREGEELLSHVELPEFNTECIECLVDLSGVTEARQLAASKYFKEHREDLQKNAREMVDKYIKKAITDFFCDDRVILG